MRCHAHARSLVWTTVLLPLAVSLASAQDAPTFVAYEVPAGTVGNQQFGGALGMDFDVELDILVTRLGVFDSGSDGLSRPITARLYDRETFEELAVLEFTPDEPGELVAGSRFKELDEPIELPAGSLMTISAGGYGAGEPNGNQGSANLGLITNRGPCSINFVGGGRFGNDPNLYPDTPDGGPANRYAAGTFEFEPLEKVEPDAAIAYVVPEGTGGNQAFTGPLGLDFDVNVDLVVTSLGVFDSFSDGLLLPITARIFDRDLQLELVNLEFTPDDEGDLVEGSRFKELDEPLCLPAGFHGTVVGEGYGDLEQNGNDAAGGLWFTDNGGCAVTFVGGGRFGDVPGAFPTNVDGGPVNRYAAGTFEFEASETPFVRPDPPTAIAAEADGDSVTVSWNAPAGGPEVVGYHVVQVTPGPVTRVNDDLIDGTELTVEGLVPGTEACFLVYSVSAKGLTSTAPTPVCATISCPEERRGGIAYEVPEGTAGTQNFAGALGLDFNILKDIEVTSLGVFDDLSDGLVSPINARLYNRETQEVIASLDFTLDEQGELNGGSRFLELDQPVTLRAGFQGTMVASGYGAGDRNGNVGTIGLTTNDGDCSIEFVGGGRFGDPGNPLGFPGTPDGGPVNRYAAGTFEFEPTTAGEAPNPPTNLTAELQGDRVALTWQAPAGGAPVVGYNVFFQGSGQPLNQDVLTDTSFTAAIDRACDGIDLCFVVRSVAGNGEQSAASDPACVALEGGQVQEGHTIAYDIPRGTAGNQAFAGPLGMDFDVQLDVLVTRLGAFDHNSDGLRRPITVSLYDRVEGELGDEPLATLEFSPDDCGTLIGGHRFKELEEPIELPAGFAGTIVAEGYGADEMNGNGNAGRSTSRGPCSIDFVGGGRFGDPAVPGAFPTNVDGGPANRYAAGTFEFLPLEQLDPADREGGIAYEVPEFTAGGQAFGGPLGMDFNVVADIEVTALGVFDDGSDGLNLPLNGRLYDRESQEVLASFDFTADDPGELIGGSRFKELDEPLTLRAGFHGTIVASGYGDGELNGNGALGQTTNDGSCSIEFVGSGRFGDPADPLGFPGTPDGGPVNRYTAGTFAFEPVAGDDNRPRFVRGDANSDGSINLTDGIRVLNFLFLGEEAPDCLDAGDFDDTGADQLTITDAIGIFNWLFLGAEDPPPPTPSAAQGYPASDCGPDPTDGDGIGCARNSATCSP